MKKIEIKENKIYMVFEITDDNRVCLLHFSAAPLEEENLKRKEEKAMYFPVEVQLTGCDRPCNWHGAKNVQTSPGYRLKFQDFHDLRNEKGRKLEWEMADEASGLKVISHYQFYDGISMIRTWTEVCNTGEAAQGLESISSFCLMGICKEGIQRPDKKMSLSFPHHSWQKEMHWNTYTLRDLGMTCTQEETAPELESSQVIYIGNTGNWSTKNYLPLAYLENRETGTAIYWQIEHNGSWHWEISDYEGQFYIELSGPDEVHDHWWKKLQPGETFITVPVSIGVTDQGFHAAMEEMTKYRRIIRRKNRDNEDLPVIFNDYMNCLFGDPTTEKELPMIEKAKEAGCEYFCVDCGWYADGYWWDGVGEWLPSQKRFPGGFKEVMDAIRKAGMIPGAWLELEVMGVKCPMAEKTPDSWYFTRHGKRICDKGRYQLDYRNPEVQEYAEKIIDRLVREYGVGYIKMDYNIEPGIGTEYRADSFGEGLLEHNRAYLNWLDHIFRKYPDLIIENCSGGGMRTDYAMLSRYSIQSTSDQTDYRYYATLAANAPAALTPEQAAVWSYPLTGGDEEEVIYNMVNAMLLRIHQSGHLVNLSEERFGLVKEAISSYKKIRKDIKNAFPFWPLGLSSYEDTWICLGLQNGKKNYVAVWRRNSGESLCALPISHLKGKKVNITFAYPGRGNCRYTWNEVSGILGVELKARVSARLFEIVEQE